MTIRARSVFLLLSLIYAGAVLAHEGKTHVMGTITAVEAQHVIVTDRDGATVSITLSTDTKYEQGGAPATASALSVGTRVVVDVAGKPGHLTAIDVRIAPNAPAGTGPGTTPAGGHDQPHQH